MADRTRLASTTLPKERSECQRWRAEAALGVACWLSRARLEISAGSMLRRSGSEVMVPLTPLRDPFMMVIREYAEDGYDFV